MFEEHNYWPEEQLTIMNLTSQIRTAKKITVKNTISCTTKYCEKIHLIIYFKIRNTKKKFSSRSLHKDENLITWQTREQWLYCFPTLFTRALLTTNRHMVHLIHDRSWQVSHSIEHNRQFKFMSTFLHLWLVNRSSIFQVIYFYFAYIV